MRCTVRVIATLFFCFPLVVISQENQNGIQWIRGLSVQQVFEKAKKENKYIFLDCFATWCGPCKYMDKDVYTNDTVGKFFNQRFISVKLQMDQTKNDDEYVKSWYWYAKSISTKYFIYSYPTYLFLSPEGKPVHKEIGYMPPFNFIKLGSVALESGRTYLDPTAECIRLVEEWEKGAKDYGQLPKLIHTARAAYNEDLSIKLERELRQYMESLPKQERYTKERIEVWKDLVFSTTSKTMNSFFVKDGKIVDEVMDEKGFSARIVDRAIFYEIIVPFLTTQNKNTTLSMSGTQMGGPETKQFKDTSEADWNQLEKEIKLKFDGQVAKRNVLSARIEWYSRHFNKYMFVKYSLIRFNEYPPIGSRRAASVDDFAWDAFEEVNDKKLLKGVIKATGNVVKNGTKNFNLMDTYANLLYKIGRKKEGLQWEENALKTFDASGKDRESARWRKWVGDCLRAIEDMKADRATYGIKPLWL